VSYPTSVLCQTSGRLGQKSDAKVAILLMALFARRDGPMAGDHALVTSSSEDHDDGAGSGKFRSAA
jgi:hypothetical protein